MVFYSMNHPNVSDPRTLAQSINEVGAMVIISVLFALSLVAVLRDKGARNAPGQGYDLPPKLFFIALLLLPATYVIWSAFQTLG